MKLRMLHSFNISVLQTNIFSSKEAFFMNRTKVKIINIESKLSPSTCEMCSVVLQF